MVLIVTLASTVCSFTLDDKESILLSIRTIGVVTISAGVLAVGGILAPAASALDFTFSFNNTVKDGGTVTGIVRGLTDNSTSAATSLEVLTNTAGFGIGEYIGNPDLNSFTLSAGAITSAVFVSFGFQNTSPAVTGSSLELALNDPFYGNFTGLDDNPFLIRVKENTGLTFTPATPIPTPALLPGLLGMGIAAWRKRKGEPAEQVVETAEV